MAVNRTGKTPEARARQLAQLRPPPKGSTRAIKSGSRSEITLAPVRERHAADLQRDYPHLDPRRQVLLADRLARIELAMEWLDGHGLVRSRRGEPQPILKLLERWVNRAENLLREAEAEARGERVSVDLAVAMANLEDGDNGAS